MALAKGEDSATTATGGSGDSEGARRHPGSLDLWGLAVGRAVT